MELSTLEHLQGGMALILITISTLVAIKLILRYREYRQKESILVGCTWIGLVSPWLPDAITFPLILLTGQQLPLTTYFIIGYAFIPIFVMLWLVAFTNSLYKEKKNIILIIALILCILIEVIFLSMLITDPNLLGERIRPFQIRWGLFMMLYLFSVIMVVLITGILFARVAFITDNPEINLKGKFLLLAFLLFTTAAIIEALFHLTALLVLTTRTILTISAIFFYFGFALPERVKKIFIKG